MRSLPTRCWFLATFLLIASVAHAQTAVDSVARYQQVISVTGSSADDLYARAQEWLALTFEDSHQVVQLADPGRHVLLGRGYTRLSTRRPTGKAGESLDLWFHFRIETREGRYRVEFTDFAPLTAFRQGQYASQDVASWLASAYATRSASSRYGGRVVTKQQEAASAPVKAMVMQLVQDLSASLHQAMAGQSANW